MNASRRSLSLLISHTRRTFGPTIAPEMKPIPALEPRQGPSKRVPDRFILCSKIYWLQRPTLLKWRPHTQCATPPVEQRRNSYASRRVGVANHRGFHCHDGISDRPELLWFLAGAQSFSNRQPRSAMFWQSIALFIIVVMCGWAVVDTDWIGIFFGMAVLFHRDGLDSTDLCGTAWPRPCADTSTLAQGIYPARN